MIPVILISLLVLAVIYCEVNKAYWDHKVKQLCEKDGGVTVYEKVNVSDKNYPDFLLDSLGNPILPFYRNMRDSDPFFYTHEEYSIKKGFLRASKGITKIIRSSDKKELGRFVVFQRTGGDLPLVINHPSSFSCNRLKGFNHNLAKSIFNVEK